MIPICKTQNCTFRCLFQTFDTHLYISDLAIVLTLSHPIEAVTVRVLPMTNVADPNIHLTVLGEPKGSRKLDRFKLMLY